MMALYCEGKICNQSETDPTLTSGCGRPDAVYLYLPKPWSPVCNPENRPFPLEYSTYWVINGAEFCEQSSSAGPYCLAQTHFSCQNNAAVMDGLFNTLHVFNKILFDYLKACDQISPKLEIEQALMLIYLKYSNIWFTRSKSQYTRQIIEQKE